MASSNTSHLKCVDNGSDISSRRHTGIENMEMPAYVQSYEEALKVIEDFELKTSAKFASWKTAKIFHSTCKVNDISEFDLKGHRILFEDIKGERGQQQIEFNGVPFIVLGEKVLECQFGRDRNASVKARRVESIKRGDDVLKKRRIHRQATKKQGCMAKIVLRHTVHFLNYKAKKNSERHKRSVSNKVKYDWENKNIISAEHRIYIKFPPKEAHAGHALGAGSEISQRIDRRIVNRIRFLVGEGVHNVKEMERHVKYFVANELFKGQAKPSITSRRFYPKEKDIRNHMYIAKAKQKLAGTDHGSLVSRIEEWRRQSPKDNFFFRNSGDKIPGSQRKDISSEDISEAKNELTQNSCTEKLLFVHQTSWQQRLMKRYGNYISVLDVTHLTVMDLFPLFFIAVKTNVDYQIVASFVAQDESVTLISEAIGVVMSWNSCWRPIRFITNNNENLISSIETCFSECDVLVCDLNREQAWERWLSTAPNNLRPYKDTLFSYFNNIAKATNEDSYVKAVHDLEQLPIWSAPQGEQLRDWFCINWLPHQKRWVWAFRTDAIETTVRTNDGLDKHYKDFGTKYLKDITDKSLTGLVAVLVENFLPEKYNLYVEQNARSFALHTNYSQDLPAFFYNRPKSFVDHCKERLQSAECITKDCITERENGSFAVNNYQNSVVYDLYFGSEHEAPYCHCRDWETSRLPCEHFMAVLNQSQLGFTWDNFPDRYKNSPYLNLDHEILFGRPDEVALAGEENSLDEGLEIEIEEVSDIKMESPIKQGSTKSTSETCRDILREMISLTHSVSDESCFKIIEDELIRCRDKLKKFTSLQTRSTTNEHEQNHANVTQKKTSFDVTGELGRPLTIQDPQRKKGRLTNGTIFKPKSRKRTASDDVTEILEAGVVSMAVASGPTDMTSLTIAQTK